MSDGKILQTVLHSFDSPETLKAVLEPGRWAEWKGTMVWRNGNVRWDWKAIRTELAEELCIWEEAPAGAALRRRARLQASLVDALALLESLTSGRMADVALKETESELSRLAPGPESSLLLRKLQGLKNDVTLSVVASEVAPSAVRVTPLRKPNATSREMDTSRLPRTR